MIVTPGYGRQWCDETGKVLLEAVESAFVLVF
jgi:hypothetical protein